MGLPVLSIVFAAWLLLQCSWAIVLPSIVWFALKTIIKAGYKAKTKQVHQSRFHGQVTEAELRTAINKEKESNLCNKVDSVNDKFIVFALAVKHYSEGSDVGIMTAMIACRFVLVVSKVLLTVVVSWLDIDISDQAQYALETISIMFDKHATSMFDHLAPLVTLYIMYTYWPGWQEAFELEHDVEMCR